MNVELGNVDERMPLARGGNGELQPGYHAADNHHGLPIHTWKDFDQAELQPIVFRNNDQKLKLKFELYRFTIRKAGNTHLIPQIRTMLVRWNEINMFNCDDIVVRENSQEIQFERKNAAYASVYDFVCCHNVPTLYLLTTLAVMAVQLTLVIVVILAKQHIPCVYATSYELLFVRIFITIHLSITLANSISYSTSVVLGECGRRARAGRGTGTHNCLLEALSMMVIIPLRILLWPLCSVIENCMKCDPKQPANNCLYWHPYQCDWKQWCLLWYEFWLSIAMLVATGLIVKQQTDVVDSLFNFLGLTLVLDFDEYVAKLLPFKINAILFGEAHFRERDTSLVKIIIATWVFLGLVLYLVVI
jgi:hypothetical protein